MSTEEFTRLLEEHEAIVAEEKSRERTALQEAVILAAVALVRWHRSGLHPRVDIPHHMLAAVDALLAAEPAWGKGK